MNGQNTIAYSNLAVTLLTQGLQVLTTVQAAQASGTDITADQLAAAYADAQTSVNQLQAAIDAAKAAGQ